MYGCITCYYIVVQYCGYISMNFKQIINSQLECVSHSIMVVAVDWTIPFAFFFLVFSFAWTGVAVVLVAVFGPIHIYLGFHFFGTFQFSHRLPYTSIHFSSHFHLNLVICNFKCLKIKKNGTNNRNSGNWIKWKCFTFLFHNKQSDNF